MPVLRQNDVIESPRQPVDGRNDLISTRYRQSTADSIVHRAEVILNVDDQQGVSGWVQVHRVKFDTNGQSSLSFRSVGSAMRGRMLSNLLPCRPPYSWPLCDHKQHDLAPHPLLVAFWVDAGAGDLYVLTRSARPVQYVPCRRSGAPKRIRDYRRAPGGGAVQ